MAITNMNAVFQLNVTEVAYLAKSGQAPVRGKPFPLYIPRLMPLIDMGEPKKSKVSTRPSSVFRNAPSCAIRASNTLTSINYIEAELETNKVWRSDKAEIDETAGTKTTERGVKVICHTKSNSIDDMTFGND